MGTGDWGLGIGVGKPSYCYSPRPPLHKGWVASVYILSCAPPLAGRERATKWRGGICKGTLPSAAMKEAPHIFKGLLPHLPFTIF